MLTFSSVLAFARPHTIISTLLAPLTISVALVNGWSSLFESQPAFSLLNFCGGILVMSLSCLCANIWIVGINQVYDIDIDKINKPFLPLAAGSLTLKEAWTVNYFCLALGLFTILKYTSTTVAILYSVALVIGTLYSIPATRFKKYYFLVIASISLCRGFLLETAVYLHMRDTLQLPYGITEPHWAPIVFLLSYSFPYGVVIAIFKDLPDVQGDAKHGIKTLPILIGVKQTFTVCLFVLTSIYLAATAMLWYSRFASTPITLFFTAWHTIAVCSLWMKGLKVDTKNQKALVAYYMHIWKLFYLQFMFFSIGFMANHSNKLPSH